MDRHVKIVLPFGLILVLAAIISSGCGNFTDSNSFNTKKDDCGSIMKAVYKDCDLVLSGPQGDLSQSDAVDQCVSSFDQFGTCMLDCKDTYVSHKATLTVK